MPADRVKTLQKAFTDTLKDPELVAAAKKSKVELNPQDGNWVAKKMKGLYDMDDATLSLLKKTLLPQK